MAKSVGLGETPASLKCDTWKHFGFPPRGRCWTRTDTQLSFNKCTALIFFMATYSEWKERNPERNLAKTERWSLRFRELVILRTARGTALKVSDIRLISISI